MLESRDGRRVVITGVGVVANCGVGSQQFWDGLAAPVEPAVVRPVADFDPERFGVGRVEARRLDRFAQFALGAAAEALHDAGLLDDPTATGTPKEIDAERAGVLIGSGIGGALAWERQAMTLRDKGERAVSPLTVPMVMPNAAPAAVSMRWSLYGPCETVATSCAKVTEAVAYASRLLA
jgi:3-oxoacyl-[acyl-carrier-protein] synthase II